MAGTVVVMEHQDASGGATTVSRMLFGDTRFKVETGTGEGSSADMIFDARAQKLWSVDHAEKSYVEMDRATVRQLASTMSDAMDKMRAQLENLPADQRAMVAESMGGIGLAEEEEAEWDIKPTGDKQKVQGYTCRKYEVRRGGQLESEIWAADWKDVGISSDTFKIFESLSDFYSDITDVFRGSAMSGMELDPFEQFDRIDAFPVMIREYQDGQPAGTMKLRSVRSESLPADLFQVPSGYRPMDITPPSM
jgi:hypothetical protein